MKITEGITLKIISNENDSDLNCEPMKGSDILENHFTDKEGDILYWKI